MEEVPAWEHSEGDKGQIYTRPEVAKNKVATLLSGNGNDRDAISTILGNRNHPLEDATHGVAWWIGADAAKDALN